MSRSEFVSINSPDVKRIIDDMNTKRWTVVVHHVNGTPFTYIFGDQHLYLYDERDGGGFRKGLVNVLGHIFFFDERNYYAVRGWYNVYCYGRCYFDTVRYEALTNRFDTIGNETFHFKYDGTVDKGIFDVGDKTYCGDKKTGALKYGWWSEGKHRYLFDKNYCNGAAHEGWYRDGNAGYMCFDDHGWMREGLQFLDGNIYLFQHHGNGANSYTASGFYTDERTLCRYYFDPNQGNRALKDTWLKTGPAAYKNGNGNMYFGADGRMANGVTDIHGEKYLFLQPDTFNSDRLNAYQRDGWYTDPFTHCTYYFKPGSGQAARSVSNTPDGAAVKGVQYIDGQRYVFNQDGVLIK